MDIIEEIGQGLELQESDPPGERKRCEQCHEEKDIDRFRKVTNQYTGVHPMSICKECYNGNDEARTRKQAEEWEAGREEREARRSERERWLQWEREREAYQERERIRQQMLEAWYQQQPDRPCVACKQLLPAKSFGYSMTVSSDDGTSWIPKVLDARCKLCEEKIRIERSIPCCICQQKKGNALVHYQGYATWGGGTAIRLFCRDCEQAFLALPMGQQAFYIHTRCNLAFPPGQVIYGLRDPESHLVGYVGRTHDQKKRLQRHLKDHREDLADVGHGEYYGKATWMYDLHKKGLRPTMDILKEVEIAPMSIEWERRYILHGIQQGWPLTNMEVSAEGLVARARTSKLDFLHCSFESLMQERFAHEHGIEAFVRAFYR